MASNLGSYVASSSLTCTLASLATSSTWVAGRSTAEYDNTSGLYLDCVVSGKITVGTSPTINTAIEVWLIPKLADGTYADTFDGTDKAITMTSRGILTSYGKLVALMAVDSTTSDRGYYFSESVMKVTGLLPPPKFQLFFTHNTAVNLNATGGNHVITIKPQYITTA